MEIMTDGDRLKFWMEIIGSTVIPAAAVVPRFLSIRE